MRIFKFENICIIPAENEKAAKERYNSNDHKTVTECLEITNTHTKEEADLVINNYSEAVGFLVDIVSARRHIKLPSDLEEQINEFLKRVKQ